MENPLVAIRKEKGLTLADMGVLAGVSTMTIQRIEKGSLVNVTPDVLKTIEKWGYDRNKFVSDYEKWKTYRVKQLESVMG